MNPIDTSALEAALEQKTPTKKMSLIRQLMPRIKVAMQRGLSKKEIWESLYGAGLEMSYKMFVTYLSRIEASNDVGETKQDAISESPANSDQGLHSTHDALDQARQHVAGKDYSKIMRNRTTRTKK